MQEGDILSLGIDSGCKIRENWIYYMCETIHSEGWVFMYRQEAREEYLQALRQGHREYRALLASGKNPYPAVLDKLLEGRVTDSVQELGVVEIPADQSVGVKTAGRIAAFTAGFLFLSSCGVLKVIPFNPEYSALGLKVDDSSKTTWVISKGLALFLLK